ncbi:MAG: 23S rRNA (uridine(2552)-2'-O)-methyltransferase RlmE [Gammaproteobacteria bacterium]|nr:23S rRNA (uridine(2552)-2'-O)-methyltransferase RlmE [Gammaproteobacteria bacterium]
MSVKKRSTRSKSSQQWLKNHFDDTYVKQAQKEGYRSRAVYKLLEIQQKDRILKPSETIIDLGAAPGGWSQVATSFVGKRGLVVALDILAMDPIVNVEFIEGDFTEQSVFDSLIQMLISKKNGTDGKCGAKCVDLVMSDMAPNISGVRAVDQPRSMYLAELALQLAKTVLRKKGGLLVKVFQGDGFDCYFKELRSCFDKVVTRKPKASKSISREVYLLAKGYKA